MLRPIGTGLQQFSASPDWMSHAQFAFIYGGAKLNLPFNIDLQVKDLKNLFYEMTRFIIMIDKVS